MLISWTSWIPLAFDWLSRFSIGRKTTQDGWIYWRSKRRHYWSPSTLRILQSFVLLTPRVYSPFSCSIFWRRRLSYGTCRGKFSFLALRKHLAHHSLQLLSIGISITDGIGTNYGWGVHMKEIVAMGNFDYEHVTLISWISEVLFTICTSAIKASILYFYLRLVSTGTYRKVVWGSIAFIAVWLVTFTSVVVFVSALANCR